jgi:pimeloyl-ACP methyl ester carboxylesterase
MTDLNGSTDRISLGREVFVQAPGLVGWVELLEPSLLGTRAGEERATAALTSALERQQFTTVHSLEINATPVVGPATPTKRGPDNRPLLTLEVPDIGREQQQVVLLADEQGVVTWHFAQPGAMPNMVRFEVPADTVAVPPDVAGGAERGLVSLIGKKLLSVLVFPVLEAGAQVLARYLAASWENTHRKPGLRRFTGPDDCATVTPLDGQTWDLLTQDRALLFIHGTCSTSQGGFGALNGDAWGKLNHRYGGRVFAYDHPTLSVDPLENVSTLSTLVPVGRHLDVDVVAHSRGGLVARALACAGANNSFPLHVKKIVHVGVPNAGTALANVEKHGKFVDRISTLLNLAPDGPLSVAADILDGVLTVVKIIGCNGIGTLPGLSAMDPANDWLSMLGGRSAPPHTAYAIGADYEPAGGLLQLVRVPNSLADIVFGLAPNDMVVPAGGVYDAGSAIGFPVPSERRVAFSKDEHIWHCAYFGQAKTANALLSWLPGADAADPAPV